ncbi:MAG TPA: bifunctional (p)ppGpp synthetase/guanosine-3',5'-bis(diphosphate) 3'-pyrophosphohydrolase [Clostridiales bacterium]|jgi:guanosine-3',5'-bis(diphosphate) 3'-pyrophosphohydrolase|nr:bifunctional (p)ppGpp synthetase/guanosine-3',5'-bis(diphosphate) 3'-pyrophosphohydrolase [Clostridiales bacterium]
MLAEELVSTFLERCKERYSPEEYENIVSAVEYAQTAHANQVRESGEPYVSHPLAVAEILLNIEMDSSSLIAGLLHDVVEDCGIPLSEIEEKFGSEVAIMVDGVTKLSQTELMTTNRQERQAENLRKMFLAIARDFRIVIIKLADRLHNMRTLDHCPVDKQMRIAHETIEVYAPLAHRFGIGVIKCELEDLALKYIDPVAYEKLKSAIEPQQMERMQLLESAMDTIARKLKESGIEATINGRPKHLYSIYRKIIKQKVSLDEIFDLTALRIIVNSVSDCYAVLGIVHSIWKPLPGRFKDYISTPKPNMYQSIHTTLFSENGLPFEVQIRTVEMHKTAEYGVAAHWMYKEGRSKSTDLDKSLAWFREALGYQNYSSSAKEFIENVQFDFFSDYVFVVTPRGEIIDLPLGSTPLDFAYRIHTEIGHRAIHAKVNGSIVRLDYELKTNDVVQIITSPSGTPKRDWLKIVKTQQAKAKIKAWFKKADRDNNVQDGRNLLLEALKKLNLQISDFDSSTIDKLLSRYNMQTIEDIYAAIGRGGIAVTQVVGILTEDMRNKAREQQLVEQLEERAADASAQRPAYSQNKGVMVPGFPSMAIHLANCCNPVPGDSIFGYVTKNRGVSVHRTDCKNAKSLLLSEERKISVEWIEGNIGSYLVYITILAHERKGILSDISRALFNANVDIKYIKADTDESGKYATIKLAFEVEDSFRLRFIMTMLRGIESVIDVFRVSGD